MSELSVIEIGLRESEYKNLPARLLPANDQTEMMT